MNRWRNHIAVTMGDLDYVATYYAEAEIEQARQEGWQEGLSTKMELNQGPLATIAAARAAERERIAKLIDEQAGNGQTDKWNTIMRDLAGLVRESRPAQEPAPLEKLHPEGKEGGVFTAYEVASIVNPLVAAVTDLQRRIGK